MQLVIFIQSRTKTSNQGERNKSFSSNLVTEKNDFWFQETSPGLNMNMKQEGPFLGNLLILNFWMI